MSRPYALLTPINGITMGIESASHIRLVGVLALRELALIRPADPLLIRDPLPVRLEYGP